MVLNCIMVFCVIFLFKAFGTKLLSQIICEYNNTLCPIQKERLVSRDDVWMGLLQVRVWELQPHGHRLLETLKGHKATVASIKIRGDDKECVSASCEGACIIWDIV